ncbi:AAA family ATPase [Rothia aerolata]|uniref:Nuclease SbcCD subunit C n=1 Tax=Rothia aerolata TaxID=1812262 RepID=A0A917IPW2_9MICC|nr:SMC family ATPase [Rothia aerolata]GGH59027.1 nuclease SbcCD subunit C [Rothia aerolata]
MRIHRLKLQAYGPFPGTVDLDFEELNRTGIFLLNGPTGSGKSSILDAICFALYGVTSLGRPDLKSHFAPAERAPRVELDCTVGQTRLHIERSPKWERPKKRGSGTITEQASVLVQRQSRDNPGVWEDKATRNDEAGTYITSLLGLTREQFTQVMLLPQGQFARFLNARSTEREDLLKKLFPTQTFERIQEILQEKAREAAARAEQAEARLLRLEDAARAAAARVEADLPVEQGEEAADGEPAFDVWITSARQQVGEAQQLQQKKRSQTLAALEKARAAYQQLQNLVKSWQTYESLTRQLAELEEKKPENTARAKILAEARAAAPVIPAQRGLKRALADLETVQDALAKQRKRLTEQVVHHPLAESESLESQVLETLSRLTASGDATDSDSREAALDQLSSAQQKLRELISQTGQLETEKKALQELDRELDKLGSAQKASASALADLSEQAEQLKDQRSQLQQELSPLELHQQELTAAQQKLDHSRQLHRVEEELARASRRASETEKTRLEATHHSEALQRTRYAQAALFLASELEPAAPCPVCGSIEHPAPAQGETGQELVEAQQVDDALAARDRAETAARQAQEKVTSLAAQAEALRAQGAQDVEVAQAQLETARTNLAAAEQSHRRLAELQARSEKIAEQISQQTQQDQRLEVQQATLGDRRREAGLRVEKLEDAVLPHLRPEADFSRREKLLRAAAETLQAVQQSERDLTHAVRAQERSQQELDRALEESGIESLEQAQENFRSREDIAWLEETIHAFETALTKTQTQLEEDALLDIRDRQEAGEKPPTDEALATARQALNAQEEARDALTASLTRLAGAAEELSEISATYTRHSARFAGEVEEYRMRKALADQAAGNSGDNTLAMSLTTYVLAAQLEEVTRAATGHLETMTHGRYQLRYTDEKQNRGKSGLGIAVHDTWHATNRLPATLSGGETFMASLALALGLADVVQARNGGIEIDTLFVDEGFGSLDDSTLEEVMSTLDALRERGRVIGLISHVSELKNRIPHHVQIRTSPEGSFLDPAPHRAD